MIDVESPFAGKYSDILYSRPHPNTAQAKRSIPIAVRVDMRRLVCFIHIKRWATIGSGEPDTLHLYLVSNKPAFYAKVALHLEMSRRIRRTAKGSLKWLIYSVIHTKLSHQGTIQRHLISVPGGGRLIRMQVVSSVPLHALGWTAQHTMKLCAERAFSVRSERGCPYRRTDRRPGARNQHREDVLLFVDTWKSVRSSD